MELSCTRPVTESNDRFIGLY